MTTRIYAKEVECSAMLERLQSHSNLVAEIFPYFLEMCNKFGKAGGKMPDTNMWRAGKLKMVVLYRCVI